MWRSIMNDEKIYQLYEILNEKYNDRVSFVPYDHNVGKQRRGMYQIRNLKYKE